MLLAAVLAVATGQVAKFDDRKPDAEYVTRASIGDVERCLIRSMSPPQVYRQPDRPNDVMLVWNAGGVAAGNAAARVDLSRRVEGTAVRAWLAVKVVEGCAAR